MQSLLKQHKPKIGTGSNLLILKNLFLYNQDDSVIWVTAWPWPVQHFGQHFGHADLNEAGRGQFGF